MSGASWVVEEVGDVETELAGTARGRGRGSGYAGDERRRRAPLGKGAERGGRSRERGRSERGSGRRVASSGASLGRPGRKQEVAEQGGGGARGGVAVSVLLAGRKTTGEGGRRWAGPLGELGQVSGRQVGGPGGLLSLSISVFIVLFVLLNLFCHCFEF